jgi:hypothetical protein
MNENKGSVLLLTLVFMVTSAVLTVAYLSIVRYDNILVNSRSNDAHALYIAEAGLNQAAWYLINTAPDDSMDGSWRTLAYPAPAGEDPDDPQQGSFGGGTYTIWVQDNNGAIKITSRGVYNNSIRTVHQLENMASALPGSRTLTAVAGSWGIN